MTDEGKKFFERFLSPAERGKATHDLAALGLAALPILESLFSGSAKNQFGVSYSQIGTIDCGLLVIGMLGAKAKPFERYVREWVEKGSPYAIQAMGKIGDIEEPSVMALARALLDQPHSDASFVLVKRGEHNNPKVLAMIDDNKPALFAIEMAKRFFNIT